MNVTQIFWMRMIFAKESSPTEKKHDWKRRKKCSQVASNSPPFEKGELGLGVPRKLSVPT